MRRILLCGLFLTACGGASAPAIDGDGSATFGGMRLSAPIIPEAAAFAPFSDPAAYAALTVAEKTALVTGHTHSFDDLLPTCAASDPTIVVASTSPTQRDVNYAAVATCAYKLYGPTPGWVPQLVGDVDMCSIHYGGQNWHTPSTSELVQLPLSYPQALQAAITATGTTEPMFASLSIYGLTIGSTSEVVNLTAGPPPSLTTIAANTTLDTDPVGVRCVYYEGE